MDPEGQGPQPLGQTLRLGCMFLDAYLYSSRWLSSYSWRVPPPSLTVGWLLLDPCCLWWCYGATRVPPVLPVKKIFVNSMVCFYHFDSPTYYISSNITNAKVCLLLFYTRTTESIRKKFGIQIVLTWIVIQVFIPKCFTVRWLLIFCICFGK